MIIFDIGPTRLRSFFRTHLSKSKLDTKAHRRSVKNNSAKHFENCVSTENICAQLNVFFKSHVTRATRVLWMEKCCHGRVYTATFFPLWSKSTQKSQPDIPRRAIDSPRSCPNDRLKLRAVKTSIGL